MIVRMSEGFYDAILRATNIHTGREAELLDVDVLGRE